MSRPFPPDPFLTGNYAPWPMEGGIDDVAVVGEIPVDLHGTLYRIGPNPQYPPRARYHWFDGDGMVHAFSIRGGRVGYRNRWVRTARFDLERRSGEALFGGLSSMTASDERAAGTSPNAANTNIVSHAGRLLALWEAGLPHRLDPETLETVGAFDFGGRLYGPMTAHPKMDPRSGEMLFFGYSPVPPHLQYHVVSAQGELTRTVDIDVPVPTMMHDFIVTDEHVIFLVCPATLRPENLLTDSPVRWEPDLGTRIGVMPRSGGSDDVLWLETEACYVFHPMNAYSDRQRVVADVVRYARVPLFDGEETADGLEHATPAHLVRWTLDLAAGTVRQSEIDDTAVEFPRLDERFAGQAYRHGYAAGRLGTPGEGAFNAVLHYDLNSGVRRVHDLGRSSFTSEPVFVPGHDRTAEGDGYLLAVVYREEENRSDLIVLDAGNVGAEPIAIARLPHRVPYGFHGNWVPGV